MTEDVEKRRARQKEYRAKNFEKAAAWKAEYYQRNKEVIRERRAHEKRTNPVKEMLRNARSRARRKNIAFSLVEEDVVIPSHCPVLGILLAVNIGSLRQNSITLDRIECAKGYVVGNIRVISHRANTIKNNATVEELEAILRYMRREL